LTNTGSTTIALSQVKIRYQVRPQCAGLQAGGEADFPA